MTNVNLILVARKGHLITESGFTRIPDGQVAVMARTVDGGVVDTASFLGPTESTLREVLDLIHDNYVVSEETP